MKREEIEVLLQTVEELVESQKVCNKRIDDLKEEQSLILKIIEELYVLYNKASNLKVNVNSKEFITHKEELISFLKDFKITIPSVPKWIAITQIATLVFLFGFIMSTFLLNGKVKELKTDFSKDEITQQFSFYMGVMKEQAPKTHDKILNEFEEFKKFDTYSEN